MGESLKLLLLLVMQFTRSVTSAEVEKRDSGNGTSINSPSTNDIAFDLPDLAVTYETFDGTHQLEAYKSINNDRILLDTSGTKISQLIWVSVGVPHFIKTLDPIDKERVQLFHLTENGFWTSVEMMTEAQRTVLAATARTKYQVSVNENQIVNLILANFKCTLMLFDDFGKTYPLNGKVSDFRTFPLRMDFMAPQGTIERKLFLKLTNSSIPDLKFDCSMESNGKLKQINYLMITSDQQQQVGLEEKLFGTSESEGKNDVYVSRDQMTNLATEMYSSLNIVEDYQIPMHEFSKEFVDGLISQLSTSAFSPVSIDTVLASLSAYGFDISEDIKPDVIKEDMGKILKVVESGSTSHIILDEEQYRQLANSNKNSGGFSVGGWGFEASVNFATENSHSSESRDRSLSDQLQELNNAARDEAEWKIDGNKVIPKNLNVARLTRSKMSKTLTFNRIRLQTFEAQFYRTFALYTVSALDPTSFREQVFEKVEEDIKNITQQIAELSTAITAVSSKAVNQCRVCYRATTASDYFCMRNRSPCSGWTDPLAGGVGDWTPAYGDVPWGNGNNCEYQFRLECRV